MELTGPMGLHSSCIALLPWGTLFSRAHDTHDVTHIPGFPQKPASSSRPVLSFTP